MNVRTDAQEGLLDALEGLLTEALQDCERMASGSFGKIRAARDGVRCLWRPRNRANRSAKIGVPPRFAQRFARFLGRQRHPLHCAVLFVRSYPRTLNSQSPSSASVSNLSRAPDEPSRAPARSLMFEHIRTDMFLLHSNAGSQNRGPRGTKKTRQLRCTLMQVVVL